MTEQELRNVEGTLTALMQGLGATDPLPVVAVAEHLLAEIRRLRERLRVYGEGCDNCLHDRSCTDGCWTITRHD